ncbi:MAG: hypothetical protein JWL77_6648 [Chthonomonadaceae bacterium]|nr:hypothetical protein [Chthonomonadaceae bacterium]
MKLSEMIVIGFLVAGLIAGGIYYWQYRQKAPYALSSFLGAVNSGRVKDQYDLLDDEDKQLLPDVQKYEASNEVPLGLGYAERIPKFSLATEVPDPKNPDVVSIAATMQVVDGGGTKNLTDLAAAKPYTDTFYMHKDKDGKWKVWLSETFRKVNGKLNLMASPPSPRSTY